MPEQPPEVQEATCRPETPKGQRPVPGKASSNTPCKSHSTSKHNALHGFIDEKREANLEDLDYFAVMIDSRSFIEHLLPPLRDWIDVDRIAGGLKNKGLIIEETSKPGENSKLRWKDFASVPGSKGIHEDTVFAPLQTVFDSVTELASVQSGSNVQPTVLLRMRPHHAPKSHRKTTNRPDLYFISRIAELEAQRREDEQKERLEALIKETVEKRSTKPDGATKLAETLRKKRDAVHVDREWYDVAATGEVKRKKGATQEDDDVAKVLYNMQVTMMVDPRRRFSFGITIERTSMRLWLCCRSILVVSEIIDFVENVHDLMHIFLAFAFATEAELGWDPTIETFYRANGERAFLIKVDGQLYETINILQDSGADPIISRGSRTWIVRQLANRRFYVLKDIWIEDSRDPEHIIREKILRDIEKIFGVDARKETENHLLTPEASWTVTINGVPDHTMNLIMRGFQPPFEKGFHLKQHIPKPNVSGRPVAFPAASDDMTVASKRRLSTAHFKDSRRQRPHHRIHYRIVFREVGECLYKITDLSNSFVVLRDSAKALKWIHGSGWLHRDISIGNLYLCENRGILGDLEYCKRKDKKVGHEVRSCSLDFMSKEVIENQFEFLSVRVSDFGFLEAIIEVETPESELPDDTPSGDINIPFFHFDLHDLESLWWISVWILIFNRDSMDTLSSGENGEQHDSWNRNTIKLFPRTHDAQVRQRFLRGTELRDSTFTLMSERLRRMCEQILAPLASNLVAKYVAFEEKLPIENWNVLDGTHDLFFKSFDYCSRTSTGIKLTPRIPPADSVANSKKDESSEEQQGDPVSVDCDEEDESTVEHLIGGCIIQPFSIDANEEDEVEIEDMLLEGIEKLDINDSTDEGGKSEHDTE